MPKLPIAAQLYTVRELTKDDFAGTVKQIARIGYPAVELAGFGNLTSAADVRSALHDAALQIAAAHVELEDLEANLPCVFDEQTTLGNRCIVCPWMAEARRQDAAGWREATASLARISVECRKQGFKFAYHPHSFEFQKFDGTSAMDIVWQGTDANLVKAELDVYWLKHAGEDPVNYINQLGPRTILIHLKDMAPGLEQRFAPVGEGILDFKAILAAALNLGVRWGIVEQDDCYEMPPMEALRRSFENLRRLGAV
jgi:sugar phosphate isomerase/epimerase